MSATFQAVDDANFEQEVEQHQGLALIDFWSEGCGPCKMLGAVLQDLSGELGSKAKIVKVDFDSAPELGMRFGVRGLPTLVAFKNGAEVDRLVGYTGKAPLKAWIEKYT